MPVEVESARCRERPGPEYLSEVAVKGCGLAKASGTMQTKRGSAVDQMSTVTGLHVSGWRRALRARSRQSAGNAKHRCSRSIELSRTRGPSFIFFSLPRPSALIGRAVALIFIVQRRSHITINCHFDNMSFRVFSRLLQAASHRARRAGNTLNINSLMSFHAQTERGARLDQSLVRRDPSRVFPARNRGVMRGFRATQARFVPGAAA